MRTLVKTSHSKTFRILAIFCIIACLLSVVSPVMATATTPSQALEEIFMKGDSSVYSQMRYIVDKIVMPIIIAILVVAVICQIVFMWWKSRQTEDAVKWTTLIVLVCCLIVAIIAPPILWKLTGR